MRLRILSLLALLAASAGAEPDVPAPPADAAPAVEVLDAGLAPRRELRFRPRAGDRQRLSISMKLSLGMAFSDLPVEVRELPAILMPFELSVREVRMNGDVLSDFRCGRVEVVSSPGTDPMMADMMKSTCAGVEGVSGAVLLNSRGITLETRLSIPANMDPGAKMVLESLRDAIGQVSFPLPEEAVGVGAKWKMMVRPPEPGGLDQTTTFTLRALDGDRFEVASEAKMHAGEGMIQMSPGQPPLKRRSLDSTGSSKIKGDLTHVAPEETVLETSIVERIEVKPGAVMTRKTTVKSEVKVAR